METQIIQEAKVFFDPSTLPLYFLGFLTFLTTILDDWLNPKKRFRRCVWYVQEFIYTTISIALGISICFAMETSQSICWVVAIIMGLVGSTMIRKIRNQKDNICDEIIDSVKNKAKKKIEE
jgi:hypothetical protein